MGYDSCATVALLGTESLPVYSAVSLLGSMHTAATTWQPIKAPT
jgi:hypothetical protein